MKRLVLSLLFAALAAPLLRAEYLDAEKFSKSIEFAAIGYSGSTTLENFPVLVRLSSARSSGLDYADLGSTAADAYAALRFADADGENLDYEIDTWNPAGESLVWVSVPAVSGTTTKFSAHFCADPDYALPAVYPTNVWIKADYIGVWHFGDADGTAHADATGHGLTATPRTTAFTPYASGVVGRAFQAAGTGAFLPSDVIVTYAGTKNSLTGEAWVDRNNKGGDQQILRSGDKYNNGAGLRLNDRIYYGSKGFNQWGGGYPVPSSGWTFLAAAWTDQSGQGYVQMDGTAVLSNVARYDSDTDFSAFSLTSRTTGDEPFLGCVDEFRLRRGVSHQDWSKAVYDTSKAGSTFLSYGAVVAAGAEVVGGDATVTETTWTTASASTTFAISGSGTYDVVLAASAGGTVVATVSAGTVNAASPTASATVEGLDPATAYTLQFALDDGGSPIYSGQAVATTTEPEAPVPGDGGWTTASIAGEIAVPGDPETATATIVCTPAGGGAEVTLAGVGAFEDGVLTVDETVSGLAPNTSYTVKFVVSRDGDAGVAGAAAEFATSRPAAPLVSGVAWTEASFAATNAVPGGPEAAVAEVQLLQGGAVVATLAGSSAFADGTNTVAAAVDDLLPGTAYAARVVVTVDGTAVQGAEASFTTAALGIPAVSDVGDRTATATGAFSLVGASWTGGRAIFVAFETGKTNDIVAIEDLSAPSAATTALAKDVDYTVKFVFDRADGTTFETAESAVFFTGAVAFSGDTYRFRVPVVVSGYEGSEELHNFPVLVRLSADIDGFEYTYAKPADIRVAGSDGTMWAHEVESWDPDGVSTIWVSVPSLVSNTTFTVCWRPNFGSVPSQDPAKVWTRAGYVAVWHFASQNADGSYPDSSGFGATAVPTLDARPSGPTNAVSYSQSNLSVSPTSPNGTPWHWADNPLLVPPENAAGWTFSQTGYTTETWVFPTGDGDAVHRMFMYKNGNAEGNTAAYRIRGGYQMAGDYPYWGWHDETKTSIWHHVTSVWGYTGGTFSSRVYENEGHLAMEKPEHKAVDFTTYGMGLTRSVDGANGVMNFGVDEVRVRKGDTSQAWAQANWDTQVAGTDFLSYGTVEDHGSGVLLIFR